MNFSDLQKLYKELIKEDLPDFLFNSVKSKTCLCNILNSSF